MFCFPTRSKSNAERYKKLTDVPWVIDIPVIRREELPMSIEHKVQSPSEEIIDDPSMIFFDPNEKADFVYKAVPFVSQDLDFSYVQPRIDELMPNCYSYSTSSSMIKDAALIGRRKGSTGSDDDDIPSPEYDDSLDGRQSQAEGNPKSATMTSNFYNEESSSASNPAFSTSPTQNDMLDFDDRLSYHLTPPRLESTRNDQHSSHRHHRQQQHKQQQQQQNYQDLGGQNHENFINEYEDVNIYEEDNIFSVRNMNLANKGYVSDAESIKTYQDSGVYDGDLADSPKSISSVARQLAFDDYDNEESKFAAFKTPMSSRQSSIESLLMQEYSTLKDHHSFSNKENQRNELNILDTSKDDAFTKQAKLNNKYKHVQAKVQCHRSKHDRSPSPGKPLKSSPSSSSKNSTVSQRPRSTSPGDSLKKDKRNKSPGGTYANNTISSSIKAKTKLKSNEKSVPNKKIFNEKLTFREKAKSKTDSHGVEMYSNLPIEFQEIARRLARQDRELKKSQSDLRGRSNSRKSSRVNSRTSSLSPTRGSRARSHSQAMDSNMEMFTFDKDQHESTSKQLSRSSSIRSIPSTPALSRQHPLPELQARAKSPSASPRRSPAHRTSHEKERTKTEHYNMKSKNNYNNSNNTKNHKSTPSPVSKLYTFTTVNDSFATSPIRNINDFL